MLFRACKHKNDDFIFKNLICLSFSFGFVFSAGFYFKSLQEPTSFLFSLGSDWLLSLTELEQQSRQHKICQFTKKNISRSLKVEAVKAAEPFHPSSSVNSLLWSDFGFKTSSSIILMQLHQSRAFLMRTQ